MFVGDLVREFGVVRFVIFPPNPLFWHSRGTAGFEDIKGAAFVCRRNPDFRLQITERFVLKVRELQHVCEALNLLPGIEVPLHPFEPKWASSFGRKVPLDDFTNVSVKLRLSLVRCES